MRQEEVSWLEEGLWVDSQGQQALTESSEESLELSWVGREEAEASLQEGLVEEQGEAKVKKEGQCTGVLRRVEEE